jgi:hypothetical protein
MDHVFVGVLLFSVMQHELVYNVKEGCISKEGSSPIYVCIDTRFKVGRRGMSDADDGLHGRIKMQDISS